jgi:NADH-quinone oxidoreductase subunit H
MSIVSQIIFILVVQIVILSFAGMLVWGERRLLAFFQERYGPNRLGPGGTMQLLADMIKLFMKEDWIPPFADKPLFVLAPAVIFMTTLMTFSVIAYAPGWVVADLNVGLLFFLGMSSLSVYSVALAGWSTNNKFALIGSLRAMAQMLSYEVFMGLSLMTVVMVTGTFNLSKIVEAQQHGWFCGPLFVSLCLFFISALAEVRRTPFDLPESESELVAGYHTEYSSMKFAMFFLGEYLGLIMISMIMVTLFFGGWLGPFLPPVVWFFLKTCILIALLILIRGSLPRPRFDQLISLGWKIMLPLALLNILITGAFVLLC